MTTVGLCYIHYHCCYQLICICFYREFYVSESTLNPLLSPVISTSPSRYGPFLLLQIASPEAYSILVPMISAQLHTMHMERGHTMRPELTNEALTSSEDPWTQLYPIDLQIFIHHNSSMEENDRRTIFMPLSSSSTTSLFASGKALLNTLPSAYPPWRI